MISDLVPAVAAVVLFALTAAVATYRGQRIRERHLYERDAAFDAAGDAVTAARGETVAVRQAWTARTRQLAGQLADTQERLVHAEADRDLWQAVAARHLTRAHRSERALAAVAARDDAAAAYAPVVEAERIAKTAAR